MSGKMSDLVTLTPEEQNAISFLKDMLVDFKHFEFVPGGPIYNRYTSDEFDNLLFSFGENGITTISGSIIKFLDEFEKAKVAIDKIKYDPEKSRLHKNVSQVFNKHFLNVAFNRPVKSHSVLTDAIASAKNDLENVTKIAGFSNLVFKDIGLTPKEKRALYYLREALTSPNPSSQKSEYNDEQVYNTLSSAPFDDINIKKGALANILNMFVSMDTAIGAVDKVQDETRKGSLFKEIEEYDNVYRRELRSRFRDPKKLYAELVSPGFNGMTADTISCFNSVVKKANKSSS